MFYSKCNEFSVCMKVSVIIFLGYSIVSHKYNEFFSMYCRVRTSRSVSGFLNMNTLNLEVEVHGYPDVARC